MRRTHALVQLALALMDDPRARHWGYELAKRSGQRSAVVYRLLSAMLEAGWVSDGWEEIDPAQERRPPRRYYKITDAGRLELGALLDAARREQRFAGVFPRAAW